MEKNNSALPVTADGRQAFAQHEPNSPCELLVENLAKDVKMSRIIATLTRLCPTCSQALAELFTLDYGHTEPRMVDPDS